MKITPSKYQKTIFDTFQKTKQNIAITAVPGSGKTTTIVELLKFVPTDKKAAFVAFSKAIVEELETRVPRNINVSTLHSFGCKALYATYKGAVKVDKYKLFKIAKKIDRQFKIAANRKDQYIMNLIHIIDLYRLRLETELDSILNIIKYYGIETIGNEFEDSIKLLNAYHEYNENWHLHDDKFSIDFCDMIYLPCQDSFKVTQFDFVFIDEAQDLNKCQQKLVDKMLKTTGRFVCVGDPRQSIYLFMSSDSIAYENFAKKPNTIELPLKYCYRCGTKIVELANGIHDVIESPEGQHEGNVIEEGSYQTAKSGDFIICRNTKPLVEIYFKLLLMEKQCYIRGAEIGEEIIKLVKLFEDHTKQAMLQALVDMGEDIKAELIRKEFLNPTVHPRYVAFIEKCEIIEIISKKYKTTLEIINCCKKMFTDVQTNGIMLSTIHKSKGLEAKNVYILDVDLIPSKYATQPHEIDQENNLLYVAITRAKENLIFCES